MEELMMRALVLLVLGLRLVMRELVVPVLALAMVCSGMTWGASGGGRGEVAGCCAAPIPSMGHVAMGPPAAAQGGALVLGMGVMEEERAAVGRLGQKTVRELRELARLCGMRELARKGRKADLLEALGA
jgi:hypothetical protein